MIRAGFFCLLARISIGHFRVDSSSADQQLQRIPKTLFLTAKYPNRELIPDPEKRNVQRMIEKNHDLKTVYFGNAACASYLNEKQHGDLAGIFSDYIRRGQGKFASDVCRAAYLYHEGGFYLDNDVELVRPVSDLVDPETTFMSVWETNFLKGGTPFYALGRGVLNAVIGAEPKSTIMWNTLEKMRKIANLVEKTSSNQSAFSEAASADLDSASHPKVPSRHDLLRDSFSPRPVALLEENASFFSLLRRNLDCDEPAFLKSDESEWRVAPIEPSPVRRNVSGSQIEEFGVQTEEKTYRELRQTEASDAMQFVCMEWMGPEKLFEGLMQTFQNCMKPDEIESVHTRFSKMSACGQNVRMYYEVDLDEDQPVLTPAEQRTIREAMSSREGNMKHFGIIDVNASKPLVGWSRCSGCDFHNQVG